MELINNTTKTLRDDLAIEIKKGSKLSIAAACFSIYAFQELKKELQGIDELRFIFTSPTFITEKAKKERREFYIPRLTRERSLYGTEFEVKLRNELTQKAIAKECAEWIRQKVTFKSNVTQENMMGFINLDDKNYMPINGFTTVDLGCERGNNAYNMVQKTETPFSTAYIELFESLWNDTVKMQEVTDEVIENITTAYNENSPDFIYFVTLYNIFNEFLEDVSEDNLPNEATGFKESKIWSMLYNFQKDAVLAIISKLEKYNGCILADSVGLGKTFTALAVIKYYENRNKSVLVLCPKKLTNNWNTYKDNYVNNPIAADRLRYDVLYHTDLNRTHGKSNGLDLDRLNWSNYDLVVIDESHNFRNGGKLSGEDNEKENRYLKLLNKVIRKGVKTKVLMLSATPVNNRFNDLKNQLALAYEGNTDLIDDKLNATRSIDDIFKSAQRAFNTWSKWEPADRTTENLLSMLDFDFFEVLDSVTIARSRKHIQKYYDTSEIGTFPTRLKPISLRPPLTNLKEAINYNQIFEQLMHLSLTIYTPTHFILPSKIEKYAELYEDNKVNIGFTQANREQGIRRLTAINLMKRMESSVYSFNLTLKRILELIDSTIHSIDTYDRTSAVKLELTDISNIDEFDSEDQNGEELFTFGKKVKIEIGDMDYKSWRDSLAKDRDVLELLTLMVGDITPEYDSKLQELFRVIKNKLEHPINDGNKKIIIFTAFADTAGYLYDNVSKFVKDNFGLNTAMVSGSVEGRTTVPKLRSDLNTVLTCFSPISKDKHLLMPNDKTEIDLLIATDCISEGQNLQDCDYLINYDIHWNPVRIIQRFGRIDRIGSKNTYIQLVNFWPDVTLDEYIDLKAKVETRMKIVDMTATGDDNLLSEEEKTDLEYRKAQLKRLQEEVVDIEDMSSGISIMDLGLNEFRLDLLEYIKHHPEIDKTPFGLHSVAAASEDTPAGVIYVLKNRSNSVNIDNQNRLHPFYMVYISNEGEVICDHLSPKQMLDKMRFLCKGKTEPIPELYRQFNKETRDGRNMSEFSDLLSDAISSIIEVKEESDIDSFLGGGQVSFLSSEITGLDDFELICFLVIKDRPKADLTTKEYRLVIAGSRDFNDYALLSKAVDKHLGDKGDDAKIIIISGTAPGTDQLGERYAKERGYKLECYPADWGHYGKAAGPVRNMNMANVADDVIVFWDGESSGTKNMIETAKAKNIPCTVVEI
ncbi:helicase-related protein [Flavonifractor plautii]|uniref:helicase-related protein n=1 Tax=Flavonifractor plautii TaxID=292800 RepID=UPI0024BA17A8|nr:helicase-related protein [Flavonifractor plautii]